MQMTSDSHLFVHYFFRVFVCIHSAVASLLYGHYCRTLNEHWLSKSKSESDMIRDCDRPPKWKWGKLLTTFSLFVTLVKNVTHQRSHKRIISRLILLMVEILLRPASGCKQWWSWKCSRCTNWYYKVKFCVDLSCEAVCEWVGGGGWCVGNTFF